MSVLSACAQLHLPFVLAIIPYRNIKSQSAVSFPLHWKPKRRARLCACVLVSSTGWIVFEVVSNPKSCVSLHTINIKSVLCSGTNECNFQRSSALAFDCLSEDERKPCSSIHTDGWRGSATKKSRRKVEKCGFHSEKKCSLGNCDVKQEGN